MAMVGIGKTRTAIEYAWRYADDYTALLFLSAESPEALNSNLAGLADVLSTPIWQPHQMNSG